MWTVLNNNLSKIQYSANHNVMLSQKYSLSFCLGFFYFFHFFLYFVLLTFALSVLHWKCYGEMVKFVLVFSRRAKKVEKKRKRRERKQLHHFCFYRIVHSKRLSIQNRLYSPFFFSWLLLLIVLFSCSYLVHIICFNLLELFWYIK